jgi:hypothetical protein
MRIRILVMSAAVAAAGLLGGPASGTSLAACTVNVGWCSSGGHCTVNVGTCDNNGGCTINVIHCSEGDNSLIGI